MLLRLKFVTGTPDVLSLAPHLPTPCRYTLFRDLHFGYFRGSRLLALGPVVASAFRDDCAIRWCGEECKGGDYHGEPNGADHFSSP
jgi:hypothetical protein